MLKLKVISGNFPQVLQKGELPPAFCNDAVIAEDFDRHLADVLNDLERINLIPTKNFILKDFIAQALEPIVVKRYMQGNWDSGIAHILLLSFRDENPIFEQYLAGNENELENYRRNFSSLRFTYYNDQNIPCGVCISYFANDPNIWVAGVTQNVTALPEEKTVTLILNENMLTESGDQLVDGATAAEIFLTALNSKKIAKFLQNIILDDGAVSVEQLEAKHPSISNIPVTYSATISVIRNVYEKLKKDKAEKMLPYRERINAIEAKIRDENIRFASKEKENVSVQETTLSIQEALLDRLQDIKLIKAAKQSIFRKNIFGFIILNFLTIVGIGIGLALYDIIPLAHWGIVLAISSPPLALAAVIAVVGFAAILITIKVIYDKIKQADYRQALAVIENTSAEIIEHCKDELDAAKEAYREKINELNRELQGEIEQFNNSPQVRKICEAHEEKCKESFRNLIPDFPVDVNVELSDSDESYSHEFADTTENRTDRSLSSASRNSLLFFPFEKEAKDKESETQEENYTFSQSSFTGY